MASNEQVGQTRVIFIFAGFISIFAAGDVKKAVKFRMPGIVEYTGENTFL